MKIRELPRSMRTKALLCAALLVCSGAFSTKQALADPDVAVERSVIVPVSAAALWSRYGGFCAVANWDPAFGRCHFLKGQGDVGTVRHIERRSGGAPIVEELTAASDTSYSYRAIDGSSEGTFAMRPGPSAGTTLVVWRIAARPGAPDVFREALKVRLGPALQVALETLSRLADRSSSSGGD